MMLVTRVVLVVTVLLAAACDGRGPTTPTSPSAPPSTGGGPRPPPQSMAFEMTGVVTDDLGTPVPGAKAGVWLLDYGDLSSAFTDASGGYTVSFSGVPGSNYFPDWDPPGTEHAVAFAFVEASGYQSHLRYLLGTTPHLVENIRLHRVQRITAGESAALTIAPDDTVCVGDAWPGRGLICRTVRVVAARGGILTIHAVPTQAGPELPGLTVYNDRAGSRGNPASIRVFEGTETVVHVEMPWGINASQSVVVQTSMALR